MSAFRSRQGESDSSDDDSDDYTEDGENEDEMEVEITPTAEDWSVLMLIRQNDPL